MVNPTTVNVGLIVPLTGADVDLWGENDLNPDFVAVDGMFGGVQAISLSNIPVTLSAPAGFTPTPGAGPTQSQNRVLRFTGTLTADVTVTLPIPCSYLVENFTTGNFDVILRGATAATEVIAIAQGSAVNVYNDGSRVRFVGLGDVGKMEMWAGLSAMPSWVDKCTVKPWLLCDDTVYNIADYPYLGNRFLGKYGGNGITTFANPDLRGRFPLAYDATGTRVTNAVSGVTGNTLGSSGGTQGGNLNANQVPTLSGITGSNSITVSSGNAGGSGSNVIRGPSPSQAVPGGTAAGVAWVAFVDVVTSSALVSTNPTQTITVAYTNASQQPLSNIPPTVVTGIWVVKT